MAASSCGSISTSPMNPSALRTDSSQGHEGPVLLHILSSLLKLELLFLTASIVQGRHCFYGESRYHPGQVFPIQKGCNTCTCLTSGLIGCTANSCQPTRVTCRYRAVSYLPGDVIETGNSCSFCICGDTGFMACRTRRRCEPQKCTYKGRLYTHGVAIFDHQTCEVCRCFRGSMSCFDDIGERRARCRRPTAGCQSAGKTYAIDEAFLVEDGCTVCICRQSGYIACSKHRCRRDFCSVGNTTLALRQSALVKMANGFSGQSECAMCHCDGEARLHCDRGHAKCRDHSVSDGGRTRGVCVYKNRIYYKAGLFLEVLFGGSSDHNDPAHCRQCLCNSNGIVSCSLSATLCPRDTAVCTYGGDHFVAGDTFIETSYDYGQSSKHHYKPPPPSTTKQSLLQYINERINEAYGSTHVSVKGSMVKVSKKAHAKSGGSRAFSSDFMGIKFGVEQRDCRLCTCSAEGEVECTDSLCRVRTCTYRGRTYYSGQNFTSDDGCKVCVCTDTGTLRCALGKCNMKLIQRSPLSTAEAPGADTDEASCIRRGISYKYQEKFRLKQGRHCSTCVCGKRGKVQCTDSLICAHVPHDKKGRSAAAVIYGSIVPRF